MVHRVGLLVALIFLSQLIACSSGDHTALTSPSIDEEALLYSDTAVSTGLFPVLMQPQDAIDLPMKGLSWTDTVGILPLLPILDKYISASDPVAKQASSYETGLPANRVTIGTPPIAVFTPDWSNTNPGLENAAYAMYRFDLSGILVLPEDTVSLGWVAAPPEVADVFVGLGNWNMSRWDWYQLDLDGIITLPDTARYINPSHDLLLAVIVLGATACELSEIRLGEQELRGTGGMAEIPDAPLDPPLFCGTLPAAVDLTPGCSPVRDQGQMGACTAFAIADGAYNYELKSIYHDYGWDFADAFNLMSPRYMYVETGYYQDLNCSQGRYTWECLEWLQSYGEATEKNVPWGNPPETGWCSRDWSTEALADAALLNVETITSVNPSGTAGIVNLKTILAEQQRPVVVQMGLDWDFLSYTPGTVWTYAGPVIGYHAMCIVGYDDSKGTSGAFKVRNSWSDAWGEGGYVWISYQTFTNALPEQYLWCYTLADEYDAAVAQRFCTSSAQLPPPSAVQASDGDYPAKVAVSWDLVESATGYKVYRDTQTNEVADVSTTSWDDTTLVDLLTHAYWVQAYDGTNVSILSAPDTGYLAQEPLIFSVSPLSGGANEQVTFSADLQGSAPLTYSWNFDGGAGPNISTAASPVVVLGAEGTCNCSLTVTNDYGSDVFNFSLEVESPPGEGDWYMFGHDSQHTGRSPYVGSQTGTLDWQFTTTGPGFYVNECAIAADGTIFVGIDKLLHALNPDGTVKWTFKTSGSIKSTPVFAADGTIFIGSDDHNLYALNPDGSLKWSYTTGGTVQSSPAFGADGTIYFGSSDLNFYALHPDGSLSWSYATPHTIVSSPVIGSDGTVYVGCSDKKLYAFNPDGTVKWTYTTGAYVFTSPALGADGTIYFGSQDKKLYAVNPDGTLKWSYLTGYWIRSSPVVAADGTIYIGSRDHKLYAVNSNGTLKWSYTTSGHIDSSPAIGADGTVYVGSRDKSVYAINADGTLKWSYATSGEVLSSPSIDASGKIYIGSNDGYFYAFNPDGTVYWTYSAGGAISSSTVTASDGTLYVSSVDGLLYALYPNGTQKWTFDCGSYVYLAPAVGSDGTVYCVPDDSNDLLAINPDGTLKWTFSKDLFLLPGPAIGPDGTIYVGCYDDNLYALNQDGSVKWSYPAGSAIVAPAVSSDGTVYFGAFVNLIAVNSDGTLQWSYHCNSYGLSSPVAIGSDGTLYVSGHDDTLYAVNSNGTLKWTSTLGDKSYSCPAIGADGTVYVGCEDNVFYAINPDGTSKWTYATGGKIQSSAAIGADGLVYVGSNDHSVYALNADGTLKWSFPTNDYVNNGPSIGGDGRVYVGSDDGILYAFGD